MRSQPEYADSLSNQLDHIKAVQFDFTNDITDDNIIKKSIKYQNSNIITYIVGTQWYPYDPVKKIPNDERILYPDNIKVTNQEVFSELVGLEGATKEHFDQIIDFNNDGNITALKRLHDLNDVRWNNTNQLKEDLKEKNLIKNSINEYFNIKKRKKEKQMRL